MNYCSIESLNSRKLLSFILIMFPCFSYTMDSVKQVISSEEAGMGLALVPLKRKAKNAELLTLKRLGMGPPPVVFRKLYLLNREWNHGFFVTFKIIIRYIFSENFIEIPQVVQKLWRISQSILAIFIDFYQFFRFFDISLLQRN